MSSDDKSPNAEPQETGDSIQKRIDQLTRQKHDAARRADSAEASSQAMAERLSHMQKTIDELSARTSAPSQPPSSGADPLAKLLGGGDVNAKEAPAAAQNTPDLAALVKNAVAEAFAPQLQAQQAAAEQQLLADAQVRSFHETAKQLLPEAMESGSVAQQAFDALWNKSPGLQVDPNGPALALAAVKGMFEMGARTSKQTEDRKQAAASPTPMNSLARLGELPSGDQGERNKSAQKELAQKGATQGLSQDETIAMLGLAMGRAKATEE